MSIHCGGEGQNSGIKCRRRKQGCTLTALIDHYVAKLDRERRTLLAAAAVCGMELRIETLSRVLGLDAVQIADTCDELARERLWLIAARPTEDGDGVERSYVFRHALFRERLYEGTAVSARTELHRQTGAALEAQRAAGVDVTAAELAKHFDLGRSPVTALRYYAEVAQAALLHLSPAEAMNLTKRALALADYLPAGTERGSLEITLATLRGVAAFHTLRAGDVARVGALAGEMQSPVDEFSLAQGKAACRWFQGWADAHFGKPQEGFRQIRAAYEDNRALGMISGGSETLGYAAEALVLQGDQERAQEQLDQAFEIVNTFGERIFLPQLLLVQAEIEGSRGESAAAEASIRRAVMEARAQGACWQEVLALTEHLERGMASSEDRRALAALVDQFGETGDTSQLERARRLVQNVQQA